MKFVTEPAHVKKVILAKANNDSSGKSAHPNSLTRAFAVCIQ